MRFYAPAANSEMAHTSDSALVWRRRRVLLVRCLCSTLFMSEGIAIIVYDEPKLLGCIGAAFFGLCAIWWALFLSLSPDDLLALPPDFFWWTAASNSGIQTDASEIQNSAKPTTAILADCHSSPGVWDQEMDGKL